MSNVLIYARVSTFDQYITGHSIDAQVETGLTYAKNHDMHLGKETNCGLPGVFVDGGKSAYTKRLAERPGGISLISAVKTGDTVIATATHRMFRRTSDMLVTMERWVQQGISVIFTDYPMLSTNTANGRAMLGIFAIIAQLKSELTSARTKEALQLARDKPKEVVQPKAPLETSEGLLKINVGEVMQEVVRDREASKFRFTGLIRAYVRVSTKDQTVEQQKVCILRYLPADMRDAQIVWYEDEGASAFKTSMTKRKAGARLLADLQEGDILVAWRPDRVFRSLLDMAKTTELIHSKGAFLLTVEGGIRTDTPFGRTMVSLLSMLAEVESQEISRSTKHGCMVALAQNPQARAVRMPKFLRGMKDHATQKHFAFNQMFSPEDRMNMYIQLTLTGKNYRNRQTACRIISNKWLRRRGLPPVSGEVSETMRSYLNKVKKLQKVEFTERRDKLIRVLNKYPKDTEVMYPINITTIGWVGPRQDEFLRVARKLTGRIKDKQALIAIAGQCVSPDHAVDLLKRLS